MLTGNDWEFSSVLRHIYTPMKQTNQGEHITISDQWQDEGGHRTRKGKKKHTQCKTRTHLIGIFSEKGWKSIDIADLAGNKVP